MQAPLGRLVYSILRIGAMIALAMLLILGLFPAVLAAEAGTN